MDSSDRVSTTGRKRSHLVPKSNPDADLSLLRLDSLTMKLLDLVDGFRTAAEMAGILEVDEGEVTSRLRALGQAKIVALASKIIEERPLSEPPPTEPHLAQVKTPFSPGEEIKSRSDVSAYNGFADWEQWDGMKRGRLSDKDGQTVLEEAARSRFTGSVGFEVDGEEVTVYFEQGVTTGVKSSLAKHSCGRMLHDAKKMVLREPAGFRSRVGIGNSICAEMVKKWTNRTTGAQ